MRDATVNITFDGQIPDDINVGDKLLIGGTVIVQAIRAGPLDITTLGRDLEIELLEISVDLVADRVDLSAPA